MARNCQCGQILGFNSAHELSDHMIREMGLFSVIFPAIGAQNEKMAQCCPSGRPILAREMASVDMRPGVFEKIGLRKHMNPPETGNCFIYCNFLGCSGEGHVYYGTRTTCVAGGKSGEELGMTYYEYYY